MAESMQKREEREMMWEEDMLAGSCAGPILEMFLGGEGERGPKH